MWGMASETATGCLRAKANKQTHTYADETGVGETIDGQLPRRDNRTKQSGGLTTPHF